MKKIILIISIWLVVHISVLANSSKEDKKLCSGLENGQRG